jgi:signal peptidase I
MAAGLRALWFGVVPAAAALLLARNLFPPPAHLSPGSLAGAVARFAEAHTSWVAAAAFVTASALARYWQEHLPGARWLTPPAGPRRPLGSLAMVVGAAALAVVLRAGVGEVLQVTSWSMLPTLSATDDILVSKLAYPGHRLPRRGDVIVFRRPAEVDRTAPDDLVKRVVGLPGDQIAVTQGQLLINGWPVPRCDAGVYPHLLGRDTTLGRLTVEFLDDRAYLTFLTPFARPFAPYQVAPGEVFVLGDNRHESADSRAWNGGKGAGVPLSEIEGRVTRLLAARGRDGRFDLGTALRRLELQVHLPGMDAGPLEAGIRQCLDHAPVVTSPPSLDHS